MMRKQEKKIVQCIIGQQSNLKLTKLKSITAVYKQDYSYDLLENFQKTTEKWPEKSALDHQIKILYNM